VQPRPHRDVERLVENGAKLRRGDPFASKAKCADAPAHVTMAENLEATEFIKAPP